MGVELAIMQTDLPHYYCRWRSYSGSCLTAWQHCLKRVSRGPLFLAWASCSSAILQTAYSFIVLLDASLNYLAHSNWIRSLRWPTSLKNPASPVECSTPCHTPTCSMPVLVVCFARPQSSHWVGGLGLGSFGCLRRISLQLHCSSYCCAPDRWNQQRVRGCCAGQQMIATCAALSYASSQDHLRLRSCYGRLC